MKPRTIAALLLLILGCDDQGLPPDDTPEPVVTVQFLEASCTEVWLRLAPRNVSPPYTLTLLRNDSAVATISSPPADTTVIDEGLAPSRTYTYRARLTSSSGLNLTGDPVQARTLDTTSHQFTWETTVLGDGGSSNFYDVAIVNDTLAYAVGEVYLRDSSGVLDPHAYNLAKWDGRRWQLLRIQFYTICGQPSRTPYPASSVFAFGAHDVWVAMDGSQLARWNGTAQTATLCMPDPFVITKLWGSPPNSLWAVGYGGSIAHFDGSTWRRVESGTTANINDAWGDSHQVLCAVSNRLQSGERKLLRVLPDGSVRTVEGTPGRSIHTVWYASRRQLWIGGGGLFVEHHGGWQEVLELPLYYSTRIRGNGTNDVFVAGAFGLLGHFNGAVWHHYAEVQVPAGSYEGMAVSGDRVIAVGYNGARAMLLVGRRR